MSAILERRIDYFGERGAEAGAVRLFAPFGERGARRCNYQLEWPGHDRTYGALGEDDWQAVQLAMFIVPSAIFATDDFKAGRIGRWGHKITTYEEICDAFGVKPVEGRPQ